jgi:hypothetical protein
MKRPSDTVARIWQAVRRIEARGERPTIHGVRGELLELYGAGGSLRDISPVVAAWREEQVAKAERRIAAAVVAMVDLGPPLELEEVARRFKLATGDTLRLGIVRARKHKKLA